MGTDVHRVLAYGIKLPENFCYNRNPEPETHENDYETLDELCEKYNLKYTVIGDCEYPTFILSIYDKCTASWESEVFSLPKRKEFRNKKELKKLKQFCKDENLKFKPSWWFGTYYSY
jgi:hypothetical protein